MQAEQLDFITLDEFKQTLIEKDPNFSARLASHKLQQAIVWQLK